jgi:hypothetical protein
MTEKKALGAQEQRNAEVWLDSRLEKAFMADVAGELPHETRVYRRSIVVRLLAAYAASLADSTSPTASDDRQAKIATWAKQAFGEEHCTDHQVRGLRLLEEAIEFAQSVGVPEAQCAKLISYVYSRPAGDPMQELGGVGVTWMLAAESYRIKAFAALDKEVARIHSKPLSHFTARNQNKCDLGFDGADPPSGTAAATKEKEMPTNQCSQALSSDDPRMIAWEKYKLTEEYANTRGWAQYAQHVDGSLWAAFLVGYEAASGPSVREKEPGWISVEERLPEAGEVNPCNTTPRHYFVKYAYGRVEWTVFWLNHYKDMEVVAWLDWELPAPPKTEASKQ